MNVAITGRNPVTLRILPTASLLFLCYLAVGVQVAAVPVFVSNRLSYGLSVVGVVASSQFLATLASRGIAGRCTDHAGPRWTLCTGLLLCAAAGLAMIGSSVITMYRTESLALLLLNRIVIGIGASLASTAGTTWGIHRVGAERTAHVISWSGIASWGSLALGAPLGAWLLDHYSLAAVGLLVSVLGFSGSLFVLLIAPVQTASSAKISIRSVLLRVLPCGTALASGGVGFGVISSFITLYYASRHWTNAPYTLSVYGICFVAMRFLFGHLVITGDPPALPGWQ